jgi:hypothetical protein
MSLACRAEAKRRRVTSFHAFSQRSISRGGASIRLAYFLAMSVEQPAIAA